MTNWMIARSLVTLRNQVNTRWPNRNKDSDGSIGNAEHSARESDHNPDTDHVVKAIDITHDPKSGCDSYVFAEQLRVSRDDRIKYIISNGRICSGSDQPNTAWLWRKYTGPNKHDHHVHISVKKDAAHFDNTKSWNFDGAVAAANLPDWTGYVAPPKTLRQGSTGDGVKELQTLLNIKADGFFGPLTTAAVKKFQNAHQVIPDGVVGPQTWALLKAPKKTA